VERADFNPLDLRTVNRDSEACGAAGPCRARFGGFPQMHLAFELMDGSSSRQP